MTEALSDCAHGTSTGVGPIWLKQAAAAIWDEFTCRRCGFGIEDLGVFDRKCNDCSPRLHAEENLQ